jgi:hypothetical protein
LRRGKRAQEVMKSVTPGHCRLPISDWRLKDVFVAL